MKFVVHEQELPINLTWLRNNCRCEQCYDHRTNENKLNDLVLEGHVKHYSVQGDDLQVIWIDGHSSTYNIKWIQSQQRPEIRPKVITWKGAQVENQVAFVESEYKRLTEEKITKLIHSILQFGVAVVKNVLPTVEATEKICTQIGPVMNSFYGGMWQLDQDEFNIYKDSAYTNSDLGVHTDNSYAMEPAGVQVFHCVESAEKGGETVLVDGFKVAEMVQKQNEKYYEYLRKIPIEWHYNSKEFHHTYIGPIINTSRDTGQMEQIRYNSYHRSSRIPFMEASNLDDYYSSVKLFTNILRAPKMEWSFQLRPGNVILINNWRVLHGRKQFIGKRRLIGCYLSMNTLLSKARYLNIIK